MFENLLSWRRPRASRCVVGASISAFVIAASLAVTTATAGVSANRASAGLKIGLIMDGAANDGGYDTRAIQNLQAAIKQLGATNVTYTIAQNTPYTSQLTQAADTMISNGDKLLIDLAGGGSLFYSACQANPQVKCLEVLGSPPTPAANIQAVYPEYWFADYLIGVAGGLLSKSGKIGYGGAFKVHTPIIVSADAVALGCQSINPKCQVLLDYVNSWYDPPKETQIFDTLVSAGADYLMSFSNDAVPVQVAQKKGVWGVGIFEPMQKYGAKAYVTTRYLDWTSLFAQYIKETMDGTFKGGGLTLVPPGPDVHLGAWGASVPSSVRSKVDAVAAKIAGGWNPFVGPITDSAGKVMIPKGKMLSSSYIYSDWNWLVKGVVSS